MQDAWIVETKLVAPSPPPGWLLRDVSAEAGASPVTVLQAGAGYGKTLAMLGATTGDERTVRLWLTFDEYDTDPAGVFGYLIAGMRAHIPRFGEALEARLRAGEAEPRRLWQGFFQAIAAFALADLRIALDDFHHLQEAQPETARALGYFFDKLPSGTRLWLASRRRLALPLGRLQARGVARVLERDALRFRPEEEAEFLRARAPDGRVPEAWWHKAAGLDGWPLGLDLVTSVPEGHELAFADGDPGEEAITAYVSEELFLAQPPDQRDFLMKIALLGEITSEACRRVFQALDAAARLEALETDHLVLPLEQGSGYRLPAYLRDFLVARGRRSLPEIALSDWHRRAVAFYFEERRDELALPHLIALRDWDGAAATCAALFPSMSHHRRGNQIARWLAAFPPEVVAGDPVLSLWAGHGSMRRGEIAEAGAAYERALAIARERADQALEFEALGRLATLALFADDMPRFGTLQLQAQALAWAGRPLDLADFHLARALAAELRGDMGLMRECNEAVLTLEPGGDRDVAAARVTALMNLHTHAYHRGDLAAATRHAEDAQALASEWGFLAYAVYADVLRANLCLTEGRAEDAGAILRRLPGGWRDALDFQELAIAQTVVGHYHQLKGEWKQAELALRRAGEIFERAGHREGRKVALERQIWLALQRRQPERAAELAATVPAAPARSIHDLVLALAAARARHVAGQPARAADELLAAIVDLDALDARLHATWARLLAAAASAAAGREAEARGKHAEAVAAIEAHGYGFLLGADAQLRDELAALTGPPVIEVVVRAASPAPAAVAKLEIRCLGGFEIRVGELSLDQTLRRKGKLILAALALYPRGLPLIEIAGLLGTEDVTPGNMRTFQADISEIRRALEPGLAKGKESTYLRLVDERYQLIPEAIGLIDLQAFERGLVDAAAAAGGGDGEEAVRRYESALAHYRGNLLEDGAFGRYFDAERETLRQKALGALIWLADHHVDRGDGDAAEAALVRATAIAPTDEDLHLRLMRHYEVRGRIDRLRQVYWDCRKAYKALLGESPSAEFEGAYRRMATGGITKP